jgi:predicted PurR-regulated permease PerM
VLALLYVGRDVLIPLTLALMLSLLIAPIVRTLRRIGWGQTPSVLVAVLVFSFVVTAAAWMLGTQFLRTAASLPHYERTIQQKLRDLDEMTVGRLEALTGEASRLTERQPMSVGSTTTSAPGDLLGAAPIPVELHQPRLALPQVLARVRHRFGGP